MEISIQKLLQKMEQELQAAKASGQATAVRERIQAIKTLCELVLEQPGQTVQQVTVQRPMTISPSPELVRPVTIAQPQARKVEVEEANGDSLLDF